MHRQGGVPARAQLRDLGRRLALPAAAYVATAATFRNPPGQAERAVFTRINDGPDWRWLRAPQQLGTPWVLPAVGLAFLARGRRRDAAIAAAALPVVKGVEVATKKVLARPRPLYTMPTDLRDDAPVEGPSFPSGHTAIATCASLLLAAHCPRPVNVGIAGVFALAGYVRVHQGAHHPGDVVGGVLLGRVVVSTLDQLLPARG